jgi:hypothetical protein
MPFHRLPFKPYRRGGRSTSEETASNLLNRTLKAVEAERGNLSRAQTLLECLAIAMEYGEMDHKGPYYPDVLRTASKILRESIDALDSVHLRNPTRDKVREEFFAECALVVMAGAEMPLLPGSLFKPPRPCSLRVHRRKYSRTSTTSASSLDSASANISG